MKVKKDYVTYMPEGCKVTAGRSVWPGGKRVIQLVKKCPLQKRAHGGGTAYHCNRKRTVIPEYTSGLFNVLSKAKLLDSQNTPWTGPLRGWVI